MNTLLMYANQIGEDAIDTAVKAAETWNKAKIMKKETEQLKKENEIIRAETEKLIEKNKQLDIEIEELRAEGARLVAEGIAIQEQKQRNTVWRKNKDFYENLKQEISSHAVNYKTNKKNHIRLLKLQNNIGEKIKQTVKKINTVAVESAVETIDINMNITQRIKNNEIKQNLE